MLTIILTPISKSFSQNVTKNEDSVRVSLTPPIARLVIKDLINYDGEKLVNAELNEVVKKKDTEINLLNQNVGLYKEKVDNLNNIIGKKDEIYVLEQEKNKELTEIYKKQKRRTTLFQITTFVVSVLAGVAVFR